MDYSLLVGIHGRDPETKSTPSHLKVDISPAGMMGFLHHLEM